MQGQVRARQGGRNGQHTGQGQGEQQVGLAGEWSVGDVCVGVISPDNSNEVTGRGRGSQAEALGLM